MKKTILKSNLFKVLQIHIQHHCQAITDLFQPLNDEQLNWRTDPKEWNILQCVDHLNLTHQFYEPKIDNALHNPTLANPHSDIYKSSFWGGIYMYFALNPKLTFSAPSEIAPESNLSRDVLKGYLAKQEALLNVIDEASGIDLRNTPVSIQTGMNFNLGDCLRFLVYHDELHMRQAKGVLEALQKR